MILRGVPSDLMVSKIVWPSKNRDAFDDRLDGEFFPNTTVYMFVFNRLVETKHDTSRQIVAMQKFSRERSSTPKDYLPPSFRFRVVKLAH